MNEQAMNDVLSLIRENYPNFTKRHQILADFILNNPQESAFLSINELSKKPVSARPPSHALHRLWG